MTKRQMVKAEVKATSTAICLECRKPAWMCGEARVQRTSVWFSDIRREYINNR